MSPVLLSELEERFGYSGLFLYYETPKVACSTIKRKLQQVEAETPENVPSNVHDYDEVFLSRTFFRFAFVRNPHSRAPSCFDLPR